MQATSPRDTHCTMRKADNDGLCILIPPGLIGEGNSTTCLTTNVIYHTEYYVQHIILKLVVVLPRSTANLPLSKDCGTLLPFLSGRHRFNLKQTMQVTKGYQPKFPLSYAGLILSRGSSLTQTGSRCCEAKLGAELSSSSSVTVVVCECCWCCLLLCVHTSCGVPLWLLVVTGKQVSGFGEPCVGKIQIRFGC